MNIIFSMFLISANFYCSYSQVNLWSKSVGGANNDVAVSICQDLDGNFYITGSIQGPIAYFQTDTIFVNGFNDVFLAKYDAKGKEVWVKHFGGSYNNIKNPKNEIGQIVDYNSRTNSIYLVGNFIGSCKIDTFVLIANSPSDQQIFLAKFDLDGNCVWAKSAGSAGDDYGIGLTTSPVGNIFISGTTRYKAYFDSLSISNGGFLAMYSDNGTCKWVKNIFNGANNITGAAGSAMSLKIFNEDIFIVGQKSSDLVYLDTVLFARSNFHSSILARLDSVGNVKWAREVGGPIAYYGYLTIDNKGNCYYGSQFSGGYALIESDTIYATGATDFFFVKYDQYGKFKWVRQSKATISAKAIGTDCDSEGSVFLTGSFSGNASFGEYNINSNTDEDFFVARYDSDGNCLGVLYGGQAIGYDVCADNKGSCVVLGRFTNSISFGSEFLLSYGSSDIFITKLDRIFGIKNSTQPKNNIDQLIIYVNSSLGSCRIIIPEIFQSEKYLTLYIYDYSGRLVSQIPIENDAEKLKMNMVEEAKGVYSVVLTNGSDSFFGKIIFE